VVRACVHVFVCECLKVGLLQLGEQQGQPLHSATIFKTDRSATVCCVHIHVCHVCVCASDSPARTQMLKRNSNMSFGGGDKC